MRSFVLAASLTLAAVAGAPASAQAPRPQAAAANAPLSPAANEAAQVVNAFMGALVNGQLDVARQLMTPDAVLIANGAVLGERDAYIDGAAKADAAALKNVQRELLRRDARVDATADIALVVSEKRLRALGSTQGPSEVVVETMLLAKTAAGWKITHVHWSGRHG